eukprot:scaffold846_cov336-Pavlova_lutheri.AAC.4
MKARSSTGKNGLEAPFHSSVEKEKDKEKKGIRGFGALVQRWTHTQRQRFTMELPGRPPSRTFPKRWRAAPRLILSIARYNNSVHTRDKNPIVCVVPSQMGTTMVWVGRWYEPVPPSKNTTVPSLVEPCLGPCDMALPIALGFSSTIMTSDPTDSWRSCTRGVSTLHDPPVPSPRAQSRGPHDSKSLERGSNSPEGDTNDSFTVCKEPIHA